MSRAMKHTVPYGRLLIECSEDDLINELLEARNYMVQAVKHRKEEATKVVAGEGANSSVETELLLHASQSRFRRCSGSGFITASRKHPADVKGAFTSGMPAKRSKVAKERDVAGWMSTASIHDTSCDGGASRIELRSPVPRQVQTDDVYGINEFGHFWAEASMRCSSLARCTPTDISARALLKAIQQESRTTLSVSTKMLALLHLAKAQKHCLAHDTA
jgi:hypothetical protein